MAKKHETKLPSPWLKRIWIKDELVEQRTGYPFHIPLFKSQGFELLFDNEITIVVGDNGAGKSTLLEAIATLAGFSKLGGSQHHQTFSDDPWQENDGRDLARYMGASWLPKIGSGWFFRAESFFSLANYLESSAYDIGERGPGFLEHSHGEGFMRAFEERCTRKGIFIFDEPESALSPRRQFEFIDLLIKQRKAGMVQAIIATHSPILMAIPGAKILQLDQSGLYETDLKETAHFRLFREFCLDPYGTVEAMISE